MKAGRRFVLVLVTAPDLEAARTLARAALASRLAACVNLLPGIESHYWWEGKVESSSEVLLLLKTTRPKLLALKRLILARHPYDTPEFVALSLDTGSKRYLDWVAASVK